MATESLHNSDDDILKEWDFIEKSAIRSSESNNSDDESIEIIETEVWDGFSVSKNETGMQNISTRKSSISSQIFGCNVEETSDDNGDVDIRSSLKTFISEADSAARNDTNPLNIVFICFLSCSLLLGTQTILDNFLGENSTTRHEKIQRGNYGKPVKNPEELSHLLENIRKNQFFSPITNDAFELIQNAEKIEDNKFKLRIYDIICSDENPYCPNVNSNYKQKMCNGYSDHRCPHYKDIVVPISDKQFRNAVVHFLEHLIEHYRRLEELHFEFANLFINEYEPMDIKNNTSTFEQFIKNADFVDQNVSERPSGKINSCEHSEEETGIMKLTNTVQVSVNDIYNDLDDIMKTENKEKLRGINQKHADFKVEKLKSMDENLNQVNRHQKRNIMSESCNKVQKDLAKYKHFSEEKIKGENGKIIAGKRGKTSTTYDVSKNYADLTNDLQDLLKSEYTSQNFESDSQKHDAKVETDSFAFNSLSDDGGSSSKTTEIKFESCWRHDCKKEKKGKREENLASRSREKERKLKKERYIPSDWFFRMTNERERLRKDSRKPVSGNWFFNMSKAREQLRNQYEKVTSGEWMFKLFEARSKLRKKLTKYFNKSWLEDKKQKMRNLYSTVHNIVFQEDDDDAEGKTP